MIFTRKVKVILFTLFAIHHHINNSAHYCRGPCTENVLKLHKSKRIKLVPEEFINSGKFYVKKK